MLKLFVSELFKEPYALVFRTIVIRPEWVRYYETAHTARVKMFRHVAAHIAQMQDFAPEWIKSPVFRVYLGGVVYYIIYAYYALFRRENNPFEIEARIVENSHQFNRYMNRRERFAEFKKYKVTRNANSTNRHESNRA